MTDAGQVIFMAWASWTTTGVFSGPTGVETVEAGVLRGELDIHTTWVDEQVIITVQYSGSADWYTLDGSPMPCGTEHDSREVHQAVVDAVRSGRGPAVLREITALSD